MGIIFRKLRNSAYIDSLNNTKYNLAYFKLFRIRKK